jgi:type II secretory ATPase GspE/PulE/Tfp pilus assembly ATPase PilB-like protein
MSPTAEALPDLTTPDVPPQRAVAALLDRAVAMRASDVFFAGNEGYAAVQVRHLGVVRPLTLLPADLARHCVAHIKALAGMDTAEHRRPQDGRWVRDTAEGGRIDLRVSTMPTLYGEDCALRLLGRDAGRFDLDDLGLIHEQHNHLTAMLASPSGLLLVTGPTGSGKTTTLYACLQQLNNGERKINTIEDPIEYAVEGVRQSGVNPRIELGYPELLRAVLRQAPDVIMVGEVRDAVTAATAVHAANSGHLVLATLHAPLAAGAVQGMHAWGVNSHFLAGALLGVVAQRLVRTLCPECRAPFPQAAAHHPFEDVRRWLGPGEGVSLFAARGCDACYGTGYGGRTGVFEVLRISEPLRRLIARGQTTRALQEQAAHDGFLELRQAALVKVARGETTAEEVVRAVPPEYLGLEG